ncbi:UPF0415 protein C7orf25 homolog isoform X2 [Panulirus ornatus]|uniref:UPF0415 protein C7orf25 homolog isoform X2 n=1 Tax=Panulirus ornatus TaxID=150431 RepID=UPI003A897E0A
MFYTEQQEGERAAELALSRISEANVLLKDVSSLEKECVSGASKLRKRIEAEIKVLNKGLKKGSELKEDHVLCSNLGQLGALSSVALCTPDVCGVLQSFSIDGFEKIVVDVVADSGKHWIKVILRNPKALHMLFISGGRNGAKPLDEVADEFLICAEQHPVFYSTPKVVFWFKSGVSESLAVSLEEKGIEIMGKRIPDHELGLPDYFNRDTETESEDSDSDNQYSSDEEECGYENEGEIKLNVEDNTKIEPKSAPTVNVCKHKSMKTDDEYDCISPEMKDLKLTADSSSSNEETDDNTKSTDDCQVIKEYEIILTPVQDGKSTIDSDKKAGTIKKLNLDVTALIAYVTATANGGANYEFKDKFLTEQAKCERYNPVKETLDGYFKGRELLACQEAVTHFLEIVHTIGGKGEKVRAEKLVSRLTVVPGEDFFKKKIKLGVKVRELTRIIFGTGHAHRAITVTSNGGFVRSAEHQGVKLAVLYHKPRALTEAKEATAIPL